MPDFRMQNQFPIAEYVNAAQRKAQLDNQQTMQQSELFNQAIGKIGEIGASIYGQKKKVAQALALGKLAGIPDELSRTLEPEQITKYAATKKGYEDQDAFARTLSAYGRILNPNNSQATSPAIPGALPTSSIPNPSPDHQAGAILASQVTGTPVADPAPAPDMNGGLQPSTTGQVPVPMQMPPLQPSAQASGAPTASIPKTVSPAVQKMLMKVLSDNRPENVLQYVPGQGLVPVGQKHKGDQVITSQPKEGASATEDPKYQQRLENQYANMKLKVLSNRSGGLGLEDAKVNQGIHLRTALNSMYDPKTGNYVIPPSMHTELALGLAKMLSPSGVVPQETMKALRQTTVREGLAGALISMGFDPAEIGGTTQSVSNFFVHQLDRQAQTAEENRSGYMDYIHGQAPIDLNPETIAKHDKKGLNSYTNVLSKSPDKQATSTGMQYSDPAKERRYQEYLARTSQKSSI